MSLANLWLGQHKRQIYYFFHHVLFHRRSLNLFRLFRSHCNLMLHLPFICDLHQQLSDSGSTFDKLFSCLVQLAPPTSSSVVYSNKYEYGCLFEDNCIHMDAEKIQAKISLLLTLQIYASILYKRWFLKNKSYNQPNILVIIIHDDDFRLLSSMFNIQSECVNNIFQGWPLHMVIADLIEQLGHSLREFRLLDGGVRLHVVLSWAIYIFIFCIIVFFMEFSWNGILRKIPYKRSITGIQLYAGKSKAHIFY
uniref:Uncharacterized protein n=1 Tax=Wuchereria bancrofti TaxID=6293 RepID=A0A1I8EDG6_WUCBA